MVNLKARPFYLSDEKIRWVEETLAGMSPDEKIGQLFINLTLRRDDATMHALIHAGRDAGRNLCAKPPIPDGEPYPHFDCRQLRSGRKWCGR